MSIHAKPELVNEYENGNSLEFHRRVGWIVGFSHRPGRKEGGGRKGFGNLADIWVMIIQQ